MNNVITIKWDARDVRDALINEVWDLKDLGACFDLSAFPLPLSVGPWRPDANACWGCGGKALHVYMKILPRNDNELMLVPRDAQGRLELNTCSTVDQKFLTRVGPKASVEKIRVMIKNLVMHEVYEALMFRGERIMDPHNYRVRPEDQPF